jgi:hypothetical protein
MTVFIIAEEWRTVPSQTELEASSLGRVRRKPFRIPMPRGGTREHAPQATRGYRARNSTIAGFRMIIRVRSLRRTFKVARLVCEAFHGPAPPGKPYAMHKDDDPENNRPENLAWGSPKANLNRPQFIEFCRSRTGSRNPHRRAVLDRHKTQKAKFEEGRMRKQQARDRHGVICDDCVVRLGSASTLVEDMIEIVSERTVPADAIVIENLERLWRKLNDWQSTRTEQ